MVLCGLTRACIMGGRGSCGGSVAFAVARAARDVHLHSPERGPAGVRPRGDGGPATRPSETSATAAAAGTAAAGCLHQHRSRPPPPPPPRPPPPPPPPPAPPPPAAPPPPPRRGRAGCPKTSARSGKSVS